MGPVGGAMNEVVVLTGLVDDSLLAGESEPDCRDVHS